MFVGIILGNLYLIIYKSIYMYFLIIHHFWSMFSAHIPVY